MRELSKRVESRERESVLRGGEKVMCGERKNERRGKKQNEGGEVQRDEWDKVQRDE